MNRFRTLLAVTLVVLFASSTSAAGAEPPSSAVLEFKTAAAAWLGGDEKSGVVLTEVAGRLKGTSEGTIEADRLKQALIGSLKTSTPGTHSFFLPDVEGNRRSERRVLLLDTLVRLDRPLVGADIAAMFRSLADVPVPTPRPAGVAARGDDWNLEALRGPAFAQTAANFGRGDAEVAKQALALLNDRPTRGDIPRFFVAARLALLVDPPSAAAVREEIDAAHLKTIRAEPALVAVYAEIVRNEWNDASTAPLRKFVVDRLAQILYSLPMEAGEADAARLLTAGQYLELAAQRAPWEEWTSKGVDEIKSRGIAPRARALLGRIVAKPGSHFRILEKGVVEEKDLKLAAGLFAYLHGADLDDSSSAPWPVLNRDAERFKESRRLLRTLWGLDRSDGWTVGLLKVLERDYFPRDPTLLDVVRSIVVERKVADHPVRAELLKHLHQRLFPPDPAVRWSLAWDAVGERKLLDPMVKIHLPLTSIEFLADVCLGFPLTDQRNVDDDYGRLLDHIYNHLFAPDRTDDASCDAPQVIASLTKLFERLAKSRHAAGLAVVRKFFDRVYGEFAAEAGRSAERLTSMLVLLLRISAVMGELEPLERLPKTVGLRLFNVTSQSGFRVLDAATLAAQADALNRVTPALLAALNGPGRPVSAEVADRLRYAFEWHVYAPLLRTEKLLARATPKGDGPWVALSASYSTPELRRAAFRRTLAELTNDGLSYLNSQAAAGKLVGRCVAELKLHAWRKPDELKLSPNVNLPLYKDLLDADVAELTDPTLDSTAVLKLFADHLGPGGPDARNGWLIERRYTTDGKPVVAEDRYFDVTTLASYLLNVTTFREACRYPFSDQLKEFNPRLVTNGYRYSPEQGPVFELPADRLWNRPLVNGMLRLDLCRKLYSRALERKPELPPFTWFIELNEHLLLLPNPRCFGKAGDPKRRTTQYGEMKQYEPWKRRIVADIDEALKQPGAKQEETAFLAARLVLRLEMSLRDPEDKASAPIVIRGPKDGFRNKKYPRALRFDKLLIETHNGDRTSESAVDEVLPEILNEHGFALDKLDALGLKVLIGSRALNARESIASIGEFDVTAFMTLLAALQGEEPGAEKVAAAKLDQKIAADALLAFAVVLPYYGLKPEEFLTDDAFDGLILFNLLSAKTKERLIPIAGRGDPRRELNRKLLLAHCNLAMVLACRSYDHPELLRRLYQGKEYQADMVGFKYLFVHRRRYALSARDMFESAQSGISTSMRLISDDGRSAVPAEEAIELLYGSGNQAEAEGFQIEPLTEVLASAVRAVHSDRYANEADKEIKAAADQFKSQAKQFIEAPPPLAVMGGDDKLSFNSAPDFLWVCEEAGSEIEARAATFKPAEQADYESAWRKLVLGTSDTPPWQKAFVRRFCAAGATPPGTDHADVRRRQLAELERCIQGDERTSTRRFDGLAATASKLGAATENATFAAAYWNAARSAIWGAEVGFDLGDVAVVPFLADRFVDRATGSARAVSAAEIVAALTSDADPLFVDLDLANRWDDRYAGQPRLQELIGYAAWKEKPGPLGLGLAAPTPPRGLREAAWQALSKYAGREMGTRLAKLEDLASTIDGVATLREKVSRSAASEAEAVRLVKELIVLRRTYDQAIDCLSDRSQAMFDRTPSGDPAVAKQRRELAFDHHLITKRTFTVHQARCGPHEPTALTFLWLPFQRYAATDDCDEAGWLGLDDTVWKVDDRSAAGFILLLRSISVAGNGTAQLTAETKTNYDKWADESPAIGIETPGCRCGGPVKNVATVFPFAKAKSEEKCVDAVMKWTEFASWSARTPVPSPTGALSAGVLARVQRSGAPNAQWEGWYVRKLEFVDACDELCPPRVPKAAYVTALDPLRTAVCRMNPVATPYEGRFVNGRFECLHASKSFGAPAQLRAKPDLRETAAEKQAERDRLRDRLEARELRQVRWNAAGKPEFVAGGFLGYFDLLNELSP
jgi:hypothetical protein